ncbi:MAG: alpha-1,2-fucosyltransferase, partial [Phycisphaerales bacterium]
AMERRPLVLDVQRLATATDPADDARRGFSRRSLKRAFRDASHAIAGTDILRTADEALDPVHGRRPLPSGTTPLIAGHKQDDRLVVPTIAALQRHRDIPGNSAYLDRWLPTVTNRTVGVHVRRGDYLKPAFQDTLPVLPAAWFAHAARRVQERHGDVDFLVVTDEPAWARAHLRLPGPMTVASLDHPASPLEDLALLRACAHHVISNSTFGWWGARLSTAGGMVVAPARWTIGRPTGPHLMPAAWQRLDNPEDGR